MTRATAAINAATAAATNEPRMMNLANRQPHRCGRSAIVRSGAFDSPTTHLHLRDGVEGVLQPGSGTVSEMIDTTHHEDPWEGTVVELLEPEERDVAVLVAVGDGLLGDADLVTLTGQPIEAVAGRIRLLEDTGLIRRDSHAVPISAHDLVRHAVLDTLAPTERRELHRRIARHLDSRGDCPSVIAAHIEASGDAALCRRGIVLALAACHQSLVLGEVEASLAHLQCAARLLRLLDAP